MSSNISSNLSTLFTKDTSTIMSSNTNSPADMNSVTANSSPTEGVIEQYFVLERKARSYFILAEISQSQQIRGLSNSNILLKSLFTGAIPYAFLLPVSSFISILLRLMAVTWIGLISVKCNFSQLKLLLQALLVVWVLVLLVSGVVGAVLAVVSLDVVPGMVMVLGIS
ncbi:hypothetical protein F8M41_007634 [Gigaspora margarita]|uniref:Uncharacterized protein n=1 Tax=Gigaspora margarita TaxID=4874 RepID=A0A8H4A2X7_GIGMA|nr:hypothetical protein F8M41_007634 [Gigaspora margarita]